MTTITRLPHILCVDDEAAILMSLKRLFRGSDYKVTTAKSAQEGLEHMAKGDSFDLIISDMRMPEMDGAEFLAAAAQFSPDSLCILLTGYADQGATVRAVNSGQIYHYINKPWDNEELRSVVETALRTKCINDDKKRRAQQMEKVAVSLKHQTIDLKTQVAQANQDLEQTVSFLDLAREELQENYLTTIKSFASLVNLRVGQSHQVTQAIVNHAVKIGGELGLEDSHISDIEHAALLCQLGKIGFSDELLATPLHEMTNEQKKEYCQYPIIGEQTLMPMNAMAGVAKIIRHHSESFDGSGKPEGLANSNIPLASRILRVAVDFNVLVVNDFLTNEDAKDYILMYAEHFYDPDIVRVYLELLGDSKLVTDEFNDITVATHELKPGMVISRDLFNRQGMLILAKNAEINLSIIDKLTAFESIRGEILVIKVNKHQGLPPERLLH